MIENWESVGGRRVLNTKDTVGDKIITYLFCFGEIFSAIITGNFYSMTFLGDLITVM